MTATATTFESCSEATTELEVRDFSRSHANDSARVELASIGAAASATTTTSAGKGGMKTSSSNRARLTKQREYRSSRKTTRSNSQPGCFDCMSASRTKTTGESVANKLALESKQMANPDNFAQDAMPYMNQLFATAMRMTRNKADAEDLVQETFLKGYKAYGRFQEGTNLRAWLFRILTNSYINRYRKAQRTPAQSDIDDVADLYLYRRLGGAEGAALGKSAEDELFEQITDGDVLDAVESLPEKYRQAVLLADVEGFAYKEIAEILDMPIGTVMSRLHRGRKRLQESLYEFGRERGYIRDEPVLKEPVLKEPAVKSQTATQPAGASLPATPQQVESQATPQHPDGSKAETVGPPASHTSAVSDRNAISSGTKN